MALIKSAEHLDYSLPIKQVYQLRGIAIQRSPRSGICGFRKVGKRNDIDLFEFNMHAQRVNLKVVGNKDLNATSVILCLVFAITGHGVTATLAALLM